MSEKCRRTSQRSKQSKDEYVSFVLKLICLCISNWPDQGFTSCPENINVSDRLLSRKEIRWSSLSNSLFPFYAHKLHLLSSYMQKSICVRGNFEKYEKYNNVANVAYLWQWRVLLKVSLNSLHKPSLQCFRLNGCAYASNFETLTSRALHMEQHCSPLPIGRSPWNNFNFFVWCWF